MNIVLLLTACVNPNGMAFTALQNQDERLKQYIKSIKYYLEATTYKIVVVENTNFDLTKYVDYTSLKERIEFCSFDGNNYDKEKGKGYGEALIIKYAFENSLFLKDASLVVKISGRYITSNISNLMHCIKQLDTVYVNTSKIKGRKLCDSRLFAAPSDFYTNYFLPLSLRINDSQNNYFEHVLYEAIILWSHSNKSYKEFIVPLLFVGTTGSTGKEIVNSKFANLSATIKYILHKLGIYINRR